MRGAVLSSLGLLLLSSPMGFAKDSLPWRDANPLERPAAHHREKRAEAPKPKPADAAAPAATAVPRPEARPAAPADKPEPVEPVAAPPAPPVGEVAKPEVRPNSPPEAGTPPAGPVDPQPASTDPAATADRPVTDIPVPDVRPKPTSAEAAPVDKVEPPAAPAPVAPQPPSPEEAPNSTEKLKSREPAVTPAASVEAAAAVEDAERCEGELKARGVEFTVEETISEGECGVLRPVHLKRLSSGVEVTPKTQMLCRTALALDDWMTGSVVPAAKTAFADDRLNEFRHASTYVCRPRASESGISEHARGSAIDIGSFVFRSGREIGIAAKDAGTPEARFLDSVRAGACGPFKTVLGPGTDADHDTHFHLDIAARSNGGTYCK